MLSTPSYTIEFKSEHQIHSLSNNRLKTEGTTIMGLLIFAGVFAVIALIVVVILKTAKE